MTVLFYNHAGVFSAVIEGQEGRSLAIGSSPLIVIAGAVARAMGVYEAERDDIGDMVDVGPFEPFDPFDT